MPIGSGGVRGAAEVLLREERGVDRREDSGCAPNCVRRRLCAGVVGVRSGVATADALSMAFPPWLNRRASPPTPQNKRKKERLIEHKTETKAWLCHRAFVACTYCNQEDTQVHEKAGYMVNS
eukprot:m.119006 g.119006  ORF g.119006 m.119006 type:complete len:122 (+) comp13670_c1_seq5:2193-2558(+)